MPLLFGLGNTNQGTQAPQQPAHFLTNLTRNITNSVINNSRAPIVQPAPITPIAASIGRPSPNTSSSPNVSNISGRMSAPAESLPWYMQPGRAASDTIKGSVDEFATRVASAYHSLFPPQDTQSVNYAHDTNVQKVSKVITAGLGALDVAFSPVSGLIKGAEKIPVVKVGAQLVDAVFQKTGNIGGMVGSEVIDKLPVSDETKSALKPPVSEMFGLLAQLALGKIGHEAVGKIDDLHSKISDIVKEEAKNVSVQSQTPDETQVKINTPSSKHTDYAASQGYEPYTPSNELPTIEAGARPRSELPTIQTEPPAPTGVGQFKYEQIDPAEISKLVDNALDQRGVGIREKSVSFFKNNPADITQLPIKVREVDGHLTIEDGRHRLQAAKELKMSNIQVEDVTPHYTGKGSTVLQSLKPVPIEGTGGTKVHGLSAGVEQSAIEKKLTTGFGDLPEYQTMNIKEQAKLAAEALKENYDQAKRVALGQEPAPRGLHPEAIFTAVEARAIKEGDVNTLRDLATRSSLTGESTTMGQRIKLLDERNPDSPVKAIRDVVKAREDAIKKRVGDISKEIKKTAKAIKAEVDAVKPKRQDWTSFIREIQC